MSHVRKLALAVLGMALCVAALGAGSASATVLCSSTPATNDCPEIGTYGAGTEFKAVMSGGIVFSTTGGVTLMKCEGGGFSFTLSDAGGSNKDVVANNSGYHFSGCSRGTKFLVQGQTKIHWSGSHNGTVDQTSTSFEISNIYGTRCVYSMGSGWTLQGGAPASFGGRALLPRTVYNGVCAAEIRAETYFEIQSPSPLYVESL